MMLTRRPLWTLLPLLAGCGTEALFRRNTRVSSIAISVVEDANDNAPVALDLVYVAPRQPLPERIGALTASEWFEKRAQFLRDWPRDLDVRSWEVVPGQTLPETDLPSPEVRGEAFLFALYRAEGVHRARLAEGGRLMVRLLAEEMQVTES